MVLYIVVRHPQDPRKSAWNNKWIDEDIIDSIETTPTVADQCRQEGTVFVHRCAWKGIAPIVSSCVQIAEVSGTKKRPIVRFKEGKYVGKPVRKRLYYPANSYYAPEP